MDYNTVMTFINGVGFPISCVLLLAWYVRELTNNHKNEINTLTERMTEINVNLERLASKLEVWFGERENGENEKSEN